VDGKRDQPGDPGTASGAGGASGPVVASGGGTGPLAESNMRFNRQWFVRERSFETLWPEGDLPAGTDFVGHSSQPRFSARWQT
jgi:hypothetical protein